MYRFEINAISFKNMFSRQSHWKFYYLDAANYGVHITN